MKQAPQTRRRAVVGVRLFSGMAVLLGAATEEVPAQTVRDSAGGRVITYAAGARPAQQWSVETRPLLAIGGPGASGAAQFWMIAGVLGLADRSIAVADADSREIRVFDRSGRHVLTFGGRGSGPGELTSLWRIWRSGDLILAHDGQGRVHRFTSTGEYRGAMTPPVAPNGRRLRSHGVLGDGSVIAAAVEQDDARGERFTRFLTLHRIGDAGTTELGRFPAYEALRRPNAPEQAVIYGPNAQFAVFPDRYCAGYSAEYVIRCFDARGRFRTQIVRRQWQSPRVTDADRQTFFAGIDEANPGPRGADYRAQVRATTVFAERFPAFGRFVPAANGELWVGPLVAADETLGTLNPSPPEPTTWSVYAPDGAWLADVTLPARFRLMDAGLDYVSGVLRDADDVERVVVYALRR